MVTVGNVALLPNWGCNVAAYHQLKVWNPDGRQPDEPLILTFTSRRAAEDADLELGWRRGYKTQRNFGYKLYGPGDDYVKDVATFLGERPHRNHLVAASSVYQK